jgi:hypothetical protein
VTRNGPHRGRVTKMPFKELQEFACELNRRGVRLPFRPRRAQTLKIESPAAQPQAGATKSSRSLPEQRPAADSPRTILGALAGISPVCRQRLDPSCSCPKMGQLYRNDTPVPK